MASSSRSPLRVGLLGYGLGGRVFHAPLVAATPGLELAAVVTRDPERRAHLRAAHPGAAALDTPEALVGMAGEHRSRRRLHAQPDPRAPGARGARGRAAGGGGQALRDRGRRGPRARGAGPGRGLLLTVFQNRRWDGDFLTVRRLVEEGALGEVRRLESRFERWSPAARVG